MAWNTNDRISFANLLATSSIAIILAIFANKQQKNDSVSSARTELSKTLQIIIEGKTKAGIIHVGGDLITKGWELPKKNDSTLSDFKFNLSRSHLGWMRSTEVLVRHAIVQTKSCEELVTPYDNLVIASALYDSGNPAESLAYAKRAKDSALAGKKPSLKTSLSKYERDNIRLQVNLHSARVYFAIHSIRKGNTCMREAMNLISQNTDISKVERSSLFSLVHLLWADFQAPLVGLGNPVLTKGEVIDHVRQADQIIRDSRIREGEWNSRLQQLFDAVDERVNRILEQNCLNIQSKIPHKESKENSLGMIHLDFEVQRTCRLLNHVLVIGKIENNTKFKYRVESISISAFDKDKKLLGREETKWNKDNELECQGTLDMEKLSIPLCNIDSTKVANMEWKIFGKKIELTEGPKVAAPAPKNP